MCFLDFAQGAKSWLKFFHVLAPDQPITARQLPAGLFSRDTLQLPLSMQTTSQRQETALHNLLPATFSVGTVTLWCSRSSFDSLDSLRVKSLSLLQANSGSLSFSTIRTLTRSRSPTPSSNHHFLEPVNKVQPTRATGRLWPSTTSATLDNP